MIEIDLRPKDEKELRKILPEIWEIDDVKIRDEVIDVFLNHVPDYFWEVPASSSGKWHQKDVVDEKGLLVHTKRTFTALDRIYEAFTELGRIDEEEVDYARAGVLLHDVFKQGIPPAKGETVSNHDAIAAEYLEENTDLPEEVIRCVHTHNGAWYYGDEPESELEFMHHLADMVGSGRYIYSSVMNPSDEIRETMIDEFPKSLRER